MQSTKQQPGTLAPNPKVKQFLLFTQQDIAGWTIAGAGKLAKPSGAKFLQVTFAKKPGTLQAIAFHVDAPDGPAPDFHALIDLSS